MTDRLKNNRPFPRWYVSRDIAVGIYPRTAKRGVVIQVLQGAEADKRDAIAADGFAEGGTLSLLSCKGLQRLIANLNDANTAPSDAA